MMIKTHLFLLACCSLLFSAYVLAMPAPIVKPSPPLNGGCITSGTQTILINTAPSPIFATVPSGGSCSSYQYQWQISFDNSYFRDIPGATGQNLTYSAPLAQTTYFQRKTICGSDVAYTTSVIVFTSTSVTTYYNSVKSATFIRNNCAIGYTGSNVTYTVAAAAYSSTTSQTYADNLAQNDVNNNGQAYANANGTCTLACSPSRCTGNDKKCVNGVCETGNFVVVSSVRKKVNYNGTLQFMWVCTRKYCFSDGSLSDYQEDSYNTSSCPVPFCGVLAD